MRYLRLSELVSCLSWDSKHIYTDSPNETMRLTATKVVRTIFVRVVEKNSGRIRHRKANNFIVVICNTTFFVFNAHNRTFASSLMQRRKRQVDCSSPRHTHILGHCEKKDNWSTCSTGPATTAAQALLRRIYGGEILMSYDVKVKRLR